MFLGKSAQDQDLSPPLATTESGMWKRMKAQLRTGMKRKQALQCGDQYILRGREPLQMGWYEFASMLVEGQTVLDVGCGSGEGLKLLSRKAGKATGIDLDQRLEREDVEVEIKDISKISSKSFDAVVCIDVIEHVEDDTEFVKELVRVARKYLLVTTPNYAVSRNLHPYHVREYTPYEFERLFSQYGSVRIFGGNSTGAIRSEIRRRWLYFMINEFYSWKLGILLAKILKRLLFLRVWPHQAAIVAMPACQTGTSLSPWKDADTLATLKDPPGNNCALLKHERNTRRSK